MRIYILIVGLLLLPTLIQAQDAIRQRLVAAQTLKCFFPIGVVGDWTNTGPTIERDSKGLGTFHFDGIEARSDTARLIANQGSTDVLVVRNSMAITFIETTGIGNVIITTVFANYQPGTDHFLAVTSRHVALGIPGVGAVPSQYYGTCQVWE